VFPQILKQWFWDFYDHLVRLLVANVAIFFLFGGLLFTALVVVGRGIGELGPMGQVLGLFVAAVVFLPLWLAGWYAPLAHFAEQVTFEKDPGIGVLVQGYRTQFLRVWLYLQLVVLAACLLAVNIWFYALASGWGFVGFALAGLCFWALVLFLAAAGVGLPFLVRQRLRPVEALRRGGLLLLQRPGLVISFCLFLASLWVIGFALRLVGVFFFAFSGTVMFLNSFYDVVTTFEQRAQAVEESDQEPRPRTWKELRAAEKKSERERMDAVRYSRTIRDILRPWEG